MKKYFIFILTIALMMMFLGCSKSGSENISGKNSSNTSTQNENYYGYERKDYKAGMEPQVDAAVTVAKEWYYARAVQGDMAKEFDLLTDGARQISSKEEYVRTTKQESNRPGWEVKKEKDGEVKKIMVENPDENSITVYIFTLDEKALYGIWVINEKSSWKVNRYGRAEVRR